MIKKYASVLYTILSLTYLCLSFRIFCVQRVGLRCSALQKLRARTFEITAGEMYAYYLTMHGIKYRTRKSAYIYALQYLYYIGQVVYEESHYSHLLSICMIMSAVRCAFIVYIIQEDCLASTDHGQQVIGFPCYIIRKIKELRESVRAALYFIWIGSVYGVLHGYRGPIFTGLFTLFVIGDIARAVDFCRCGLMVALETIVFLIAIYLESGMLIKEADPSYVMIIVYRIILLFGDLLLSVITSIIESTGVLSKVAQAKPNHTRSNKLPGGGA